MKFKNFFLSTVLISTLSFSSVTNASVALFNPAAIVTATVQTVALRGLAMALVGGVGVAMTNKVANKKPLLAFPLFSVSGILLILGIMALDNGDSTSIQFKSLTESEAQKLSITESELLKYNQSIEVLNAINESIALEISEIENESDRAEQATKLWTEAKALLDEEVLSATQKILMQVK